MASANNAKKGANVRMKRKERKNIAAGQAHIQSTFNTVTTMKCSAWPPAPTSRKIPSSSGRIWNKKRMCGKGLEKVPFPPPYPLRVASFPRIPHGRREWRAPATVNGKTIIEHSVRCVSIFLKSGVWGGVGQLGQLIQIG